MKKESELPKSSIDNFLYIQNFQGHCNFTGFSKLVIFLIDRVFSAELLGEEVDCGSSLLGLGREEVLAEGGDGVDDGAVVRPVQRLVNVTLGRLPVSGGCWLKSKVILN